MRGVEAVNATLRRVPVWSVYVAAGAWALWLFWQGLTGALGPEPVNALLRRYGELALWFLVAGLLVTPLRRWGGVNLIRFRRALGLVAFGMVVAHLLVWAVLDLRDLTRIAAEIVKRPYITVGFAAFLLLVPLALTSTDRAVRRMGPPAWRRLHRLVYAAVPLGGLHYLWLVKGWPAEPFVWLAVILVLLALRLPGMSPQRAALR